MSDNAMLGVGAVSVLAGAIIFLTTGDDDTVAVAPAVGRDFGGVAFSGRF